LRLVPGRPLSNAIVIACHDGVSPAFGLTLRKTVCAVGHQFLVVTQGGRR
jgi:hypothetical protein